MKVNGLKTAVKAREMTPQEALAKLVGLNKDTPHLIPNRTIQWLKNKMK